MRHKPKKEIENLIENGEAEIVRDLTSREIDWYDRLNSRQASLERSMAVALNTFNNMMTAIGVEVDEFWQSITGEERIGFRDAEYMMGQHEGRMVLVKQRVG
jgi:predicted Zn-dependent protease with MMP-like domain